MATQDWPGPNGPQYPRQPEDRREYYPVNRPPQNVPQRVEGNVVGNWAADQAKDYAKGYAIGKAAEFAGRTALGARMFMVTRWFWMAEWGALGIALLLAVLSVITAFQHDYLMAVFGFIVAGIFGLIWLAVRAARRFVERQAAKAFARFQNLVARGAANPNDWPRWFRQHRREV